MTLRLFKHDLSKSEHKAFQLHIIYSLIEGIILGVLALNEFVFVRSLLGSDYQLGFLFQFSMIVFIFLLFFNEFLNRAKSRKKLLRYTAILTRAPLAVLIFFPASADAVSGTSIYHYIFLTVFLIYYMGNPIIYPTINLFLKTNYRHQNFGYLYSFATSLNKIAMLLATLAYGFLLDADHYAFRWVFPLVAILAIGNLFLLSMIPYKDNPSEKTAAFISSVKKSAWRMWGIIRDNKPYRDFEMGFMFYGFAFMITVTVVVIFFNEQLMMNYTSYAFYKNIYNVLAIVMLPFFGKLLGKIDPRKFAAITFGSLMAYLFFVMLTEYFPQASNWAELQIYYMLIPAFIAHGVFAASMSLLWSIGSAYFCRQEEASDYQSVHLTLTAIRAIFAPILGIVFYKTLGFTWTFMISIVSLALAMLLMRWSYRRYRQH